MFKISMSAGDAMVKHVWRLGLTAALALGASAWAEGAAGPVPGKAYLMPGLAIYQAPDGDDYDGGAALGLGYMMREDLGLELLYSNMNAYFDTPDGRIKEDADLLWLNLIYRTGRSDWWQPFLLFGGGRSEIGGSDDAQFNIGFGVFGKINQRFSYRADIRAVHSSDAGGVDPFAFVGLTASLGEVAPPPPPDADGDGVPDQQDRCPDTPAGVRVDADGCPLDGDGDGVPDYLDDCPGTVAGAMVDSKGCHLETTEEVSMEVILEFDFDSAEVRSSHYGDIRQVAEFMRTYPDATAVLEGHADSRGPDAYNQRLSGRRANAVLARLVEVEGIAPNRLRAVGYGETQPLVEDSSKQGYQRNRRVRGKADGTRVVIRMK